MLEVLRTTAHPVQGLLGLVCVDWRMTSYPVAPDWPLQEITTEFEEERFPIPAVFLAVIAKAGYARPEGYLAMT